MNDFEEETFTAVNGRVRDEDIEEALSSLEDKPQLIRILASKQTDDLRMLSEVPRRLVFLLVNIDVVIEARRRLVNRLREKSKGRLADHHLALLEEESGLLQTWLRSFLLYMRGVDRKFIGEVLEAYVAASASEDEGREIEAE